MYQSWRSGNTQEHSRRLSAIIIKEFIQLVRDPRTLMMALLLPVIQLFLFGYAISTDVERLPTVVVDHARTQESRALLDRFAASRYYLIRYQTDSLKEAEDLVHGGRARVVIVIPPDFADRLRRGVRAQALVIVDASDPTVARSALTTAEAIGQVASLEIVSRLLGASTARIPLEIRTRAWYNPDLRSANFMVPGLLARGSVNRCVSGITRRPPPKNFQQALQLSQITLLPSILISGFLFPRESLPVALQWAGLALPLTYYIIVVRGILIKGVGLEFLWRQIIPLVILALIVFGMAISRFQKKID